jgi:hypothetical protein
MDDNTIDVEVVSEEIIRCPQCGTRNRLLKQKKLVAYRCGGCATPLENPFAQKSTNKRRFQGLGKRASSPAMRKFVGLFVVGILVVIAVLRRSDEPSPPRRSLINDTPRVQLERIDPPPSPRPASSPQKEVPVPPANPPRVETPAAPPRSLGNGTILVELPATGPGRFTIENETRHDAVVKLVDEAAKYLMVAVYVRAHSSTTVERMPEGNFAALCAEGVDWDDSVRNFKRQRSFWKVDQKFDFNTRDEYTGNQVIHRYKVVTLELAPSIEGNITRSEINEEEFAKY